MAGTAPSRHKETVGWNLPKSNRREDRKGYNNLRSNQGKMKDRLYLKPLKLMRWPINKQRQGMRNAKVFSGTTSHKIAYTQRLNKCVYYVRPFTFRHKQAGLNLM
jgi:hypothetical protein